VGYGALVAYAALMLIVTRFDDAPRPVEGAARFLCWLFAALIAANAIAALAECGFGPCPDNPTGWLWSK